MELGTDRETTSRSRELRAEPCKQHAKSYEILTWTQQHDESIWLTEGPVGKSSYSPNLGGTTCPGKHKPFVSGPASRDFSDDPGMVQGWAHRKQHACVYAFIYAVTIYYVSGTSDTAVNEAGKLLVKDRDIKQLNRARKRSLQKVIMP